MQFISSFPPDKSPCFPLVVSSTGAVLYRIPLTWGQNKLPWKLLHAALMLVALVLSIVGLCAVFDFHNANDIPNLYSLHSWIGIAATALFAIQVCRLKHKVRIIRVLLFFPRVLTVRPCVRPVGGGRGRLPPALLPRVATCPPQTRPCVDGRQHTVAQHCCLHLRDQREALLLSVSVLFSYFFMNSFISERQSPIDCYSTAKEPPMEPSRTLNFQPRPCLRIH